MPIGRLLRHPLTAAAALAGLLAAASVLMGARTGHLDIALQKAIGALGAQEAWRNRVLLWWLAAVPAIGALMVARRWPLPSFVAAAASGVAHQLQPELGLLPMDLAAPIALYAVASRHSRRVAALALAGGLAALYLAALATRSGFGLAPLAPSTPDNTVLDATVPALLLGVAWALGDGARTRRLHLATVQQRAADLQRERDQRAALAVAAERARIARELHDVVAHSMTVMVIQAQAADAFLPAGGDESREHLAHVITGGRAALAEMRRLLGLIRAADPAPQPGVGALPDLLDEVRDAGTPVSLRVEGEPAPLPGAVDLSTYRIVQEALTNTRKHAGAGARATVRLAYAPTHLDIEVSDDGVPLPAGDIGGHGLRGLTERVAALGGTITAQPGVESGFTVRARLPIEHRA